MSPAFPTPAATTLLHQFLVMCVGLNQSEAQVSEDTVGNMGIWVVGAWGEGEGWGKALGEHTKVQAGVVVKFLAQHCICAYTNTHSNAYIQTRTHRKCTNHSHLLYRTQPTFFIYIPVSKKERREPII